MRRDARYRSTSASFFLLLLVTETSGFGGIRTINNVKRGVKNTLYERNSANKEVEESLNDVDARVLQSMLTDQKLDLDTEDGIRKLLERGTVKRVKVPDPTNEESINTTSEFSSKAFQKLSETKLFQKLSRNAADFLESAGIAILNKIERDVKVVAALGVFAWDRAVRDVGRALPATSSAAVSSSTTKPFRVIAGANNNSTNIRPQDELRMVRESVTAIVQGNTPGRSLRTAAPTGRANAKVRQTKAFVAKQRKQQQPMIANIPKVGGAVLDTAYELQRELSVETSQPGYRTAPARAAIRAATKGLIDQARTAVALRSAQRQKQLRPIVEYKFGSTSGGETETDPGIVSPPDTTDDEPDLPLTAARPFTTIPKPQPTTKRTVSSVARNDEAYTYSYQDLQDYAKKNESPQNNNSNNNDSSWQGAFFATQKPPPDKIPTFQSDIWKKAIMVDDTDVAIPTDVEYERSTTDMLPTYQVEFNKGPNNLEDMQDGLSRPVEIVSEEDFIKDSNFFAEAKTVAAVGDDENLGGENQSLNPLTRLALRSFDIVFFVLEKVLLVAVPETFATISRVSSRLESIRQNGRGTKGWMPLQNIAPTKGRY